MENIYLPKLAEIKEIIQETNDTKTIRLAINGGSIDFLPGQFGEFSVIGEGESTFGFSSSPLRKEFFEFSFRTSGRATTGINGLNPGDKLSFRGPYGNYFDTAGMKGKNLVFVGGGIGMAPVKSILEYCFDERDDYGKITVLYGARTVNDLLYRNVFDDWKKYKNTEVVITVDPGGETPDWTGKVGFVPTILEQLPLKGENSIAVVCGPPIMIKFALKSLEEKMGFDKENIITTLENRMKCGLGKCGRCNVGSVYVCKDGPVFTARELESLPNDF
ncbi:MAG: FAD/NAD(P)-binding protein [Deltaproteobacteria bacterium]|jgi:NAD(P)H-flavin reductase|nr:FAD/NAD(P)-binding protein [Deltaproteobacteria bacterium]MCL5891979.1 FAD/NAD(P)-binding protein [Deltaproteobacteria bacterium]